MTSRETLVRDMQRARRRTLRLVDFDDAELRRQYDPLMSPLVWDLAHIGQQEELWLLRGGDPDRPGILSGAVESLYDAFVHSRASRVDLPLLSPEQARTYCRTVRTASLDALDRLPDEPDQNFVYGMMVSHENQHDETMLQALNLRVGPALLSQAGMLPSGRAGLPGTSVEIPGGPFVLGVDGVDEPFSLDNERPAHVVDVPTFRMGRVPVTNGEWRQFIDDGGYAQPRWWSPRGWEHRMAAELTAPQFWSIDGHTRTRFGVVEDIPADEPVQHVSYFEAEAYAAWAGGSPAHRTRMGEGVCVGPAAAHAPTLSVGRRGSVAGLRQSRRRGTAAGTGRRLSGRRVGLRRRADAGRRLGVDQLAARAVAGLHADDLPTLFGAFLRRGLPGTARRSVGRGLRHRAAQLP